MPGADANAGDSSRPRLRPRAARTPVWHAGLVVAAVLVVYANALRNAFLWDDLYLVAGNPAMKHWANLPRLFVSDLFPGAMESLLPLAPESLRVRVNLAQAYQEAGDLERARAAYEEVVRLHPDRPETAEALNNLGNIHREAGRLEMALGTFDRALRPRHVAARNGRALTLQGLGRVEEAERALAAALAIDPEATESPANL